MYCKKCGRQILAGGRFCGSCGEAVSSQPIASQPQQTQNKAPTIPSASYVTPSYANPVKSNFTALTVLSIVLLLNVFFVPMFSVWGGLSARWADQSFMTALGNLGAGRGYWHDIFIWSAFVPGVVLFISSLAKTKVMAIISSLGGVGLLFINLTRHVGQVGSNALNPDDGNIAIGFWIALILFAMCFFCSIAVKKNAVPDNIYTPTP